MKLEKIIQKSIDKIIKEEMNHYIVIALMLVFIFSGMTVPDALAEYIDSPIVKLFLYIIAGAMLFNHPVLGAVSLFFVYELILRSTKQTGNYYIQNHLPSERQRSSDFVAMNDFPVTLEEEVVQKMVPISHSGPTTPPKYKPVMNKLNNAAKL